MQGLWVALGAALGALLRWRMSLWLNPVLLFGFPLGTWLVNVLGGLGMGLALAYLAQYPSGLWRALLVTGFLGGFTTFSTFSAESLQLLQAGRLGPMLAHSVAHVGAALLSVAVGWHGGRWVLARGWF